jgi:peptidoglycan/LPS O-acetylase OafA/YrhL
MTVAVNGEATGFPRQRLDNLQVLRGLAALCVLFVHGMYAPGNFGVDIFFCISGFIMVYVTQSDAKHFFPKRIVRIVPLYWYATFQRFAFLWIGFFLGVAGDIGGRRDLPGLVGSLLFLPINGSPIVPPAWTLYYEMAFYAVFGIACLISLKRRSIIAFGLLALIVCGFAFAGVDYTLFFELAGGMGAFYVIRFLHGLKRRAFIRVICAVAALVSFASLWLIESFGWLGFLPQFIRFGVPAFVFVAAFVKATQGLKMPRFLVLFGDISFSFYLMHMDVLAVIKGVMVKTGIITDYAAYKAGGFLIEKILSTAIGFVVTIGVSIVTYLLIEKRLTGFLRRKFVKG